MWWAQSARRHHPPTPGLRPSRARPGPSSTRGRRAGGTSRSPSALVINIYQTPDWGSSLRVHSLAGPHRHGLRHAEPLQEEPRHGGGRRLQPGLQRGRVQQSAEGGEPGQPESAALHELRPDRDGRDGLLLWALSWLWEVRWGSSRSWLTSHFRIPPGRKRFKKLIGRKIPVKKTPRGGVEVGESNGQVLRSAPSYLAFRDRQHLQELQGLQGDCIV